MPASHDMTCINMASNGITCIKWQHTLSHDISCCDRKHASSMSHSFMRKNMLNGAKGKMVKNRQKLQIEKKKKRQGSYSPKGEGRVLWKILK